MSDENTHAPRIDPIDRERHQPVVEVKGATYTALSVGPVDGGRSWQAQAVVDV